VSGAWLCTGDANLRDSETQRRVGQHARLFSSVDAVHVPHHGSPHNLDGQAVRWLQSLSANNSVKWVISSGKNQWRYPHHAVEAACGKLYGTREASCHWSDVVRF
jgi:beta-lactamase superfamily II metal-dependent hydrolase